MTEFKGEEFEYGDILLEDEDAKSLAQDGPEIEGVMLEELGKALTGTTEYVLASINGWPEVKTEFRNKCIKIFGKKICTKVPVVYQRTSKLEVVGQVSHPDLETIAGDIADCVRQAVAAGVAAGALTGNVGAAVAAFESYLKACLAAKGARALGELRVGLFTRKTPGEWH